MNKMTSLKVRPHFMEVIESGLTRLRFTSHSAGAEDEGEKELTIETGGSNSVTLDYSTVQRYAICIDMFLERRGV